MADYTKPSPFDDTVEKATTDTAEEANWAMILDICDKAGQTSSGSKDCVQSIMKRLAHSSKNVHLKAITLLDSCILNCGSQFHKEIATPEFVKEARSFLGKASPQVADKFKEHLRKWAENEFKSDSKLSVIPTFYQALRSEGAYFGMGGGSSGTMPLSSTVSSSSAPVAGVDDDLEKAIALSLKESQKSCQTSSLYPQMSALGSQAPATDISLNIKASRIQQPVEPAGHQVRALYDFEAVEDNELTFKTGELITVLDDSDPNWWKGSTWRGEGLFPVNFVTSDISLDPNAYGAGSDKKSVQFNEEVQVEQFDPDSVKIDENVIDQALDQIQNADPTGLTEDSQEMLQLEEECKVMGPLIDQELEQIDSKHNELMSLNQKLTDAFQLYTQLMKEATNTSQYAATVGYMQQTQTSTTLPTGYVPQQQIIPGTMYSYSNTPQEPTTQAQPTQSYYNASLYGGQMQIQPSHVPQNPHDQQQTGIFNQQAMLQQYQMSGTAMTNLPPQYIPSPAGAAAPYNNMTQPGYQQQVQTPQQLS